MKVYTLFIQETISKKLYTIYKKPKPYLKQKGETEIWMVLVISTGKRQIRLSSNVSRKNNKWLEQLERFYSGKN